MCVGVSFMLVWRGIRVAGFGIDNQPIKHTTHIRTQQSQNRKHHNSQYQYKHVYQLQQFEKASHTKRTPLHTIILL